MEKQISTDSKLKDDVVNLSQKILVEQFKLTCGFEDTTLKTKFTPVSGKFYQILHTSEDHWVMVTRSIFEEVDLFDSLQTSYPKSMIKSVAKIVNCSRGTLKINVRKCQQQINGIDCGIFAISNAVKCLHGGDVETALYDPTIMRKHLLTCSNEMKFKPFPKTTKRVKRKGGNPVFFDIYCTCWDAFFAEHGQNDPGKFMACCSICQEWFHKDVKAYQLTFSRRNRTQEMEV